MAELKLTIGPLSASVTANNTKAQTVLNNFLLRIGYSGPNTDQDKLNAIVVHLKDYLTEHARQYQSGIQSAVATQAALNDANNAFEA